MRQLGSGQGWSSTALAVLLAVLACGPIHGQFDDLPEQLAVEFGETPDVGQEPEERPRGPFGERPGMGMGLFDTEEGDNFAGVPVGEDEHRRGRGATSQPIAQMGRYGQGAGGYGYDQSSYGYGAVSTAPRQGYRGGSGRHRYVPNQRLRFGGQFTQAFRANWVSGDAEQFDNQWADNQRSQRNASVHWTGQAFGPIYTQGNLRLNPYAPTVADWSVSALLGSFMGTYGDLNVNMGRNPFVNLQKSIKGWEAFADFGRTQASFFTAGQKGRVRTDRLPGEGTSGPYRLRFAPIRDGSERVQVDGVPYSQAQYNLDYDTGLLVFEDGIIIAPTSIIEVKYEENNFSSTQGQYFGVDFSTSFGAKVPLGVTWLMQRPPGGSSDGNTSKVFEERFPGNNTTGPFILGRRPIDFTKPIVVYVDGVQRFKGQDWEINPSSGAIVFYNMVSATATVVIIYYYIDVDETPNQGGQLVGIDSGYRLDNGAVGVSYGLSRGGDGSTGHAFKARGMYDLFDGRLHVDAGYINMTPTFKRIDALSFQRDRKGFDLAIDAAPIEDLRLWFDTSRDFSNTGYATGASPGGLSGVEATSDRFDIKTFRWSAGMDYARGSWPHLTFDMSRVTSGSPTGSNSFLGTESLGLSKSFGSLSLGFSGDQTRRKYTPSQSALDAQEALEEGGFASSGLRQEDSLTRQFRINGALNFREMDSIMATYSNNRTTDRFNTDRDSQGHSLTGALNVSPIDRLNLLASHRRTYSKGAVYVGAYGGGYYGGGGFGYGSGGYGYGSDGFGTNSGRPGSYGGYDDNGGSGSWGSGGYGGTGSWGSGSYGGSGSFGSTAYSAGFRSDQFTAARTRGLLPLIRQDAAGQDYSQALTDDRSTDFAVDWTPIDRLSLNYNLSMRRYSTEGDVGFIADNDTTTHSVGFMVRPMSRFTISGDYSRSNTRYLDHAVGAITTDSFMVSADWQLSNKINANFGYYVTNAVNPAYSGASGDTGGITIMTGSSFATLAGGLNFRLGSGSMFYGRAERNLNRGAFDDSDRFVLRFGFEQDISRNLFLNIGLRHVNYTGRQTLFGLPEDRHYKATTLGAELGARFN